MSTQVEGKVPGALEEATPGGLTTARSAGRLAGIGGSRARNIAPLVALVAVIILFSFLNGRFLTIANARTLASQGAILMVLAVGATFVILLGSIDLSVEGVMGMSSMVVALLVSNTRNSIDLGIGAVFVALAVGAFTGVVNGLGLTFARIPSFMITLGTWYATLGVATVLFGGTTPQITSSALLALGRPSIGGFPLNAFIALGVAIAGWLVLKYTRAGRNIRAIGSAEELVALSGVPVRRYKVLAFVFAGTLSALGGIMASAQVANGSVSIGSGLVFTTIAAVVVGGTLLTGGKGGMVNTVIGVLLLTVVTDGMVLAGISPYIQESVEGMIVVAAVAGAAWPQRSRLRIAK